MGRPTMAALAVLVLAGGCASGHEDDVRAVAGDYAQAVADQDWSGACALLAPATREELEQSSGSPCDQALGEEQPPAVQEAVAVQVFGTQAEVEYADDTLFLAEYDGRWRVVAAACTPREPRPYDCAIKGG